MKLLLCRACADVFRVRDDTRRCQCGSSGGYLDDEHRLRVWGPAVLLGIENSSVETALRIARPHGARAPIRAFVLPERHEHVERREA